jgi:hypothetical protein
VRAVCREGGANLLPGGERRPGTALALRRAIEADALVRPREVLVVEDIVEPTRTPKKRASKPRRKGKIDWTKCRCPVGAELTRTKRGQVCKRKNKFVKAVCP